MTPRHSRPSGHAENDFTLVIHRAADEIGGNCIELSIADGARILLDAGRPLDASEDVQEGLVPKTLDVSRPVTGVLLSHSHQDHYGLLDELPPEWPVYCGRASEKLIRLTSGIFNKMPQQPFRNWESGKPFMLGPFTVTPFLTDHSAFDAYMLLIEVAGKRLLYSGDFRLHGRKPTLVRRLMDSLPESIDVLLMEGTNLGSNKPCSSEDDLEGRFCELFKATSARVFVAWSAQNVDRTITLYCACKSAGRTLVVDLYTAEVMEMLGDFGRLPRPGWPNLKVVITKSFARMYRKTGRGEFVDRMAQYGISADKLAETPSRWVVMTRSSLIRDFESKGVMPNQHDVWSWSMWHGYLSGENGKQVQAWFDQGQCPAIHIHTSGHASPDGLREFAAAINPRMLIPVHGVAWDEESKGFPAIRRLKDGEPATL
ncbi:MAG: MBL fold metallo-hydrolase [Azoarcus sp.]|jgi:ribonuclease J|nr:MBL fold metallo-hydrolase [Azoarcus sp.]